MISHESNISLGSLLLMLSRLCDSNLNRQLLQMVVKKSLSFKIHAQAKWQAIHKDQKAFLAKEGGVMEAEKDERFDREWEQLNPMERQNMRDSAIVMLQDDPRVQQGAKLTFLGLSAQPDLASALAACKVDPAAA